MNKDCQRHLRFTPRVLVAVLISATGALATVAAQGQLPIPRAGRNVNMVSGTNFPGGDPFLQRQDEPSLAISTRNPLHILGGANDYRTVDLPGLPDEITGDAWLGVYKSFDGGATWQSTLLPGFRQDTSAQGLSSPLKGLQAAADPVVRGGTNGLFYFGGIAFNRDTNVGSKIFVARYIDNNNKERGDSIAYLGTSVVDVGSSTRFIDKPTMVVDIPRTTTKGGPTCTITQPGVAAQTIPAGTIYVIYSLFADNDHGEADEKRPAGSPAEGHTKILVTRSTDCGVTFSSPALASDRLAINQGSAAAIDPNTGALYVAWREFKSKKAGDSIVATRSTDGGKTFAAPVRVALIAPFDQGSTETSFRTNAYPTIAVDEGANGGAGRAYVAWSQRGVGPSGDARIVIASSANGGATWTAPVAADNAIWTKPDAGTQDVTAWRGHQIMPTLTFAGGRLQLVYFDFRKDVSRIFEQYVDELSVTNWNATHPNDKRQRHTMDVRAIQAFPGAAPVFGPSVQVSQYLTGSRHKASGPGPIQQLQFNPPNLPLFAKGTTPFIGDYIDVAAPPFVGNADGTWRYNTKPTDPRVSVAAWADNRDVRAPVLPHSWVDYTPPTFVGSNGSSLFDPTQPVIKCEAGQEGMRNQNIYSARLTSGLVMGTLGNNKPLGFVVGSDGTRRLIQRTFVVFVNNPDDTKRSVVLRIASQPPGGQASFLQFKPLVELAVDIAPRSSISREVYVTSTEKRASVLVTVSDAGSTAIATSALLNPDITNPDITNPDITNPDITNPDITNAEAHSLTVSNPSITNPDITNPDITNPDITNPNITNPSITNPDITNPDITNPNITNPDITNPDITNPSITNPDITNPNITNPDITNGSLSDITWTVENKGNTATSYQVKLLLRQALKLNLLQGGFKFQLIVRKLTAAPIAARDGCNVIELSQNLLVANIIDAATADPTKEDVFVDPTDPAQFATIVNPNITNPDITNATLALAPGDVGKVTLRVFNPQKPAGSAGDDDNADGPSAASAARAQGFGDLLEALDTVAIAGSAQAVDTSDVNAGKTTPQIDASVPLIVTTTLPDAIRTVGYAATIDSVGGADPRTLSIFAGSLPPGLTLNPTTGAISGAPTASGAFTFTVKVQDNDGVTSTAELTIRVFEPLVITTASVPGTVVNQPYSTNLAAVGGLPPYGWMLSGGALPPGVALAANGVIAGTPTQSGAFSFTVTASDSALPPQVRSATLTLNVTPTANPQAVTGAEDTANAITLSGTGAPAASFTFAISTPPAHGTTTGSGQTITYTPSANYRGPDSFAFTVTQGTLTSAPATVSVTVTPVNDAPVATAQSVTVAEGADTAIALAGTDAETTPGNLSFTVATQPAHGTLSGTAPNLTYTPSAHYNGSDSFTFTVTDRGDPDNCGAPIAGTCAATLTSGAATVSIAVTAVNDSPVAGAQSVSTPEDTNKAIVLTATDLDGDPLTFAIAAAPQHGSLTGTPPSVTYIPAANYNGPDSFTFTANDGQTTSAAAMVSITVTAVNDAPVATPQTVNTPQGVALAVTLTGTDVENGPLTFAIASQPPHGTLTGTPPNITYTPKPAYTGNDSFTFTANDGSLTSTTAATVTVVVGPPPSTSADVSIAALTDSADPAPLRTNVTYSVTVHNNGPASATGTSLTLSYPGSGLQYLSFTSSQGTCTPGATLTCALGTLASGANATVTATFKAINQTGSVTVSGSVTASQFDYDTANNSASQATTVTPNQPPTATNDTVSTNEDAGVTTTVLANDTDPENDPLTVSSVSAPAHGTAVKNADNTITYTPAANYNGPDSFSYAISDGGSTANATVNVTVTAVNDVPGFTAGANQSAYNSAGAQTVAAWATGISKGPADESAQTVNFLVANDNTALFSAQPAISPAGVLTYTPASGQSGTANVTVRIHDSGGVANGGVDTSAPQIFTITVMTATADLSIAKTRSLVTPAVAHAFTYTLTVSNAGPAPAESVTVTDTLPASLTYGSATPSQGNCTQLNGTVTCNLGTLQNAGTATVAVVVTPTLAQPVTNTATVSSTATDAAPGNNTASDSAVIAAYGPCDVPTFSFNIPDEVFGSAFILGTGDFNKDGRLDVAVTDSAVARLRVFMADVANPGTFNRTDYQLTNNPNGLVVRDFDGDGNLDIAVAISVANTITLLKGSASGAFNTLTISSISVANPTVVTTSTPHGLTTGQTVVITGANSSPSINGSRVVTVTSPTTFTVPVAVTVSGNTGSFTGTQTTLPATPQFPDAADLNGDGRPDLVTGFGNGSSISVLLWDAAAGTFAAPVSYPTGSSSGLNVILEDFDGNGAIDIATPNIGSSTISILSGNKTGTVPNGTFAAATTVGVPYPVNRLRKVGDVNGDGAPDLGATLRVSGSTTQQNLALLFNNGGGGFGFSAPVEILPESYQIGFFALNDVTGDGKSDLVAASFAQGSVFVLPGDGAGSFGAPAQFVIGQSQQNFEITDVNGDGKLDVIGIGPVASTFYVLQNTCATANTSDLSLTMTGPAAATAGDTVSYTLTVTNNGPAAASNLVFNNFVGTGISPVSVTSSNNFEECGSEDATAYCFGLPTLAVNDTATMTVTARVFGGTRTSRAMVRADEADPDAANNIATATTTVANAPVTLTVTTADGSGPGSLRQAISDANANALSPGTTNTIIFNIPGTAPFTIAPRTQLPAISNPVAIDGTTQQAFMGTPCTPGAACAPIIELAGFNLFGANGLSIQTAGSTLRGLVINRWSGSGIVLNTSTATGNGNRIAGNYIGLNAAGTAAGPGNGTGINSQSPDNIIGGTTPADRNVISGNTFGISIGAQVGTNFVPITSGAGTLVQGNYIGTNAAGAAAVANTSRGVVVNASNVTVGGTAAGALNVISGNTGGGAIQVAAQVPAGTNVVVASGAGAIIQGNYIGTKADGSGVLAVAATGITAAAPATIGGASAAARNVIAGVTPGINVSTQTAVVNGVTTVVSTGSGTVIQGNYIGTNPAGTAAANNLTNTGISVSVPNVTVGGAGIGEGNLISGNGSGGVGILATAISLPTTPSTTYTASGLVVQGNYIGTNASGTGPVANSTGIQVNAPTVTIGGTTPPPAVLGTNAGAGNLVSGNASGVSAGTTTITVSGVTSVLSSGAGSVIQGNYIGTNPTGTATVNNTGVGVTVSVPSVTVGGSGSGAGNVISGNTIGVSATGTVLNSALATAASPLTVQGNYIGTNATGTAALGNSSTGITIRVPNVVVGGSVAGAGNVISGNSSFGIDIIAFISGGVVYADGSSAVVQGNRIGTNAAGTGPAIPNSRGISLNAPGAHIGGTSAVERNVIAGNNGTGISVGTFLNGAAVASVGSGAVIEGNYIGVDSSGSTALPNTSTGISVGAPGVAIGGTAPGAANVIAGNGVLPATVAGITITGNADATGSATIAGNFIGTNAAGTAGLGNTGNGISISTSNNIVGGATAAARNVISGNGGATADAIIINGGASNNAIRGNYIGLNPAGTAALANCCGITVNGSNNTIGGSAAGEGNVISGNTLRGIFLVGNGNTVQGNLIGTDAAGTSAVANKWFGIQVNGNTNTIGGPTAGARNVISGNGFDTSTRSGIAFFSTASGNIVQGNYIGTNITGTGAIGNAAEGIFFAGTTSSAIPANNIVGGVAAGAGNLIAFNNSNGVTLMPGPGTGNAIRGNSIFSNTGGPGLGIDLGGDGVTQDDSGDGDTGANGLQNFPVVTSGAIVNGNVTLGGTLNSAANASFNLDFFTSTSCDASGFGEGRTFLGTIPVTTDPNGNATFSQAFALPANAGATFTATATDAAGNTSEFSSCLVVNQAPTATAQSASTNEDTNAPITLTGSDPENSALTFAIVSNPAHGVLTGTAPNVTYVPAANYNGGDAFTFTVNDGQLTSSAATVTITVAAINDAPSFTKGADVIVPNTAGAQTAVNWATNISAGPADEAGQAVDFLVSNSNNALFALQPAISPSGTLTYTPAANASGIATVSVQAHDNGGATPPNVDTSAAQTFAITVNPVCTAPTFSFLSFDNGLIAATLLATGDFNKDGRLDVAVTEGLNGTVAVLLANNSDEYGSAARYSTGLNPSGVIARDFNNDGKLDLAVVNGSAGQPSLSVLLGNGDGTFGAATNTTLLASPFGNEAADFNGDGYLDMLVSYAQTTSTKVSVLLNDGTGHFPSKVDYSSGQAPANPIVGDFDGNGTLDIAVPNTGIAAVSILSGNGNGTFGNPLDTRITINMPSNVVRLRKVDDIDGDGRTDLGVTLAVSNTTGRQNLALLRNISTGAGNFAFDTPIEVLPESYAVGFFALGDVTGDGKADIVTISQQTALASIVVLPGNGTFTFGTPTPFVMGQMNNFEIVDAGGGAPFVGLDVRKADGKLDIVGIGPTSRSFFVLSNNCGTAASADLSLAMSGPAAAAAGDTVIYTLTVSNNSATDATLPIVNNFLGSGLSFVAATSTTFTCENDDLSVFCYIPGTLAAHATATIDVTARAFGGTRTNRATVFANEADPNFLDNSATVATTVAAGPVTLTVSNTNDSGAGSLRQAITESNLNTGATNTIAFNLSGTAPFTIAPLSQLPNITNPVIIDGTTQQAFMGAPCTPGAACAPVVELSGQNNAGINGLTIQTSGSTVRGLVINRFSTGITLNTSTVGGNLIAGNYIGTNVAGTATFMTSAQTPVPVQTRGILVSSPNTVIGGTTAADRNVISGNGPSGNIFVNAQLSGSTVVTSGAGTVIRGNYVGTTADGLSFPSNLTTSTSSIGITVQAPNVTVGGSSAGDGNVIAGNTSTGVAVSAQTIANTNTAVSTGAGAIIQGNYIGLNAAGTGIAGAVNAGQGISVTAQATIGGASPPPSTLGVSGGAGNVISGNSGNGIIVNAATVTLNSVNQLTNPVSTGAGTVIQGNYIGTDSTGTIAKGNGNPATGSGSGASISAQNVTVGGGTTAARNVIVASVSNAIFVGAQTLSNTNTVASDGSNAIIQNNYIGLDKNGNGSSAGPLANGAGTGAQQITALSINAPNATISSNVISGNKGTALFFGVQTVFLNNATTLTNPVVMGSGATVQRNYIGTNATGTSAIGNNGTGVTVNVPNVTIGSTQAGAGNVVAGNTSGVSIGTTTVNGALAAIGSPVYVYGNNIGTNATGSNAIPNTQSGITASGSSLAGGTLTSIAIGGLAAGAGNVISGNTQNGVSLNTFVTTASIQGNLIGTNAAATTGIPNGSSGININGATLTTIGGTGAANTIAFNGSRGVNVGSGTGNSIRSNAIYSNSSIGIDLGGGGVTNNDTGDPDTGANNFQNFPVLTQTAAANGTITIDGTLNSVANATFGLDFFASASCDATGYGQGALFLGSAQVNTNGTGNVSFSLPFTFPPGAGNAITATATDTSGNTSEFSQCQFTAPLVITTTSLPNGVVNTAYTATLAKTGGVGAVTWSIQSGSLPAGSPAFALNASTGAITGTPTANATSFFTVKATDSAGQTATASLSIQINQPLVITTTSLSAASVMGSYTSCIARSGGINPVTWSVVGNLPTGMSLDSNGCLNGTPKRTGTSPFTIQLQDSSNPPQTASQALTLRVGTGDPMSVPTDSTPLKIAIDGQHQVAQVFRQGVTGSLIAVQAPVECTQTPNTNLTVEIWPVDGVGKPLITGTALVSQSYDVSMLPLFTNVFNRTFTFANPPLVPLDVRLAAVFSTGNASCNYVKQQPLSASVTEYPYGDAYRGSNNSWTALRDDDATRPDLPFYTLVDPNGALDFMAIGRSSHTATALLSNPEKVLLYGGAFGFNTSPQLYTPNLHQFDSSTAPSWTNPEFHTATRLQNGLVLIVGGLDPSTQNAIAGALLYDPATDTVTGISSVMSSPRFNHTATLLADGRVLIAGGETAWGQSLSSTDIYTYPTGFTAGPAMGASRAEHTATLLATGDVLIVGGWGNVPNGYFAERWVPNGGGIGSFTPTAQQPSFRATHSATLLQSGKVLLAGGMSGNSVLNTAELYDPQSDSFSATAAMSDGSQHHTASLLSNGKVLIAGGNDLFGEAKARMELFDPAGAGTFSLAGRMSVPRTNHTATVLTDGTVLLAGGYSWSSATYTSGERFDPAAVVLGVALATSTLPDGASNSSYPPVTLQGYGGTPPYSFAINSGAVPTGLTFTNGQITGTPTASGTFTFGVSVGDNAAHSATQALRIRIDPLDIVTASLPNGSANVAYSTGLASSGGVGAVIFSLVANHGTLPPGLSLSGNGAISGTPLQSGYWSFWVSAVDSIGQTAIASLSIQVN